jgi:hypothetical protein
MLTGNPERGAVRWETTCKSGYGRIEDDATSVARALIQLLKQ